MDNILRTNLYIKAVNFFFKYLFHSGPVVGIHVRLTDKKVEAKLQKLEDYMVIINQI